jgi:hypothetical protein
MTEKIYPLIAELTHNQLSELDLGCLAIPSAEEQQLIDKLSKQLGLHVVIYVNGYEPSRGHLCKMILPATLSSEQLTIIRNAEGKLVYPNNILVVYEKPVVISHA